MLLICVLLLCCITTSSATAYPEAKDCAYFSETWPGNHADEVLPGVWVGDICAAKNRNFLRDNEIKYIVDASQKWPQEKEVDYDPWPPGSLSLMRFITTITNVIFLDLLGYRDERDGPSVHQLEIDDGPIENVVLLKKKLSDAYDFLEKRRCWCDPIFIHCNAGRSRSALMATYYIARKYDLKPKVAYAHLQKKRPQAMMNEHFEKFALEGEFRESGDERTWNDYETEYRHGLEYTEGGNDEKFVTHERHCTKWGRGKTEVIDNDAKPIHVSLTEDTMCFDDGNCKKKNDDGEWVDVS